MPCVLPKSVRDMFKPRYDDSEAVIVYSSGTTGKHKGISLSHRAINNNADSVIDYMKPSESDCLYLNKKLTHCSSLVGEFLVSLKTGANILLAPVVIPPRVAFKYITEFKVTVLCCNPYLLDLYADEAERTGHFPESVTKIYTSGDIVSEKAIEKARKLFNRPVYNAYGQTECGPRISVQTEEYCHGNSAGKPIKNVDVKIDKSGEVLVKTNALFSGYTAGMKEIPEEWHRTGDLGYIDSNGELFIIGRTDNMIVTGSHNVYPETVEQTITDNTDIADCLVYKDAVNLACDYVSPGVINPAAVIRTLKQLLLPYEIPRTYKRVKSISRNQNGKKARDDHDRER